MATTNVTQAGIDEMPTLISRPAETKLTIGTTSCKLLIPTLICTIDEVLDLSEEAGAHVFSDYQ